MSPLPLTALSRRNVARRIVHRGPDYPDIVSDTEIGGPGDPADRRLVVDVASLEHLLSVARSSLSGRVVVHHLGLRVQLLRDPDTGHQWEHLTLIGDQPRPEVSSMFGSGL